MKKIIATIFLSFAIIGCTKEVSFKQIVKREGIFYLVNETKPFTGKVKDEEARENYEVKKGQLDGKYTSFHENGQLKEQGAYKNGKFNGQWTVFYENGEKAVEAAFEEGKQSEEITFRRKNGSTFTMKAGDNKGLNSFKIVGFFMENIELLNTRMAKLKSYSA